MKKDLEFKQCIDCKHKRTSVCNSCDQPTPTNFEED
jgi:hypothetical protein